MNEEIGKRMSALIRQQNMTQRELAERVGVTECAVSKYICGEREPRVETLANIATALGTTMEYLLGRSDGVDTQCGTIYDLCARHSRHMTPEERNRLIAVIVSESVEKGM